MTGTVSSPSPLLTLTSHNSVNKLRNREGKKFAHSHTANLEGDRNHDFFKFRFLNPVSFHYIAAVPLFIEA